MTAAADSSIIASGHHDGSVRFWDPLCSTMAHTMDKLHNALVTHVEYSPRNCYEIMTSSRDNTLRILDTRTYKPTQVRNNEIDSSSAKTIISQFNLPAFIFNFLFTSTPNTFFHLPFMYRPMSFTIISYSFHFHFHFTSIFTFFL